MHLNSLRNANVKTLWEDDIHPHYVMRRYAEFTASLIHLNVEYGDGQVSMEKEVMRNLLIKLIKLVNYQKLLKKKTSQFQIIPLHVVCSLN